MVLFIKNMVSKRCKLAVEFELNTLGIIPKSVELGAVIIEQNLTSNQLKTLGNVFSRLGLEIIRDRKTILIEKIKETVIELVHYRNNLSKLKNSAYISNKLHYNYTYLANLFCKSTGDTLEHYIIAHKIERAKELLAYNELSLSEISYQLNYSSVAHLSAQFKKITGFTPSLFKKLKVQTRINLENVGIL